MLYVWVGSGLWLRVFWRSWAKVEMNVGVGRLSMDYLEYTFVDMCEDTHLSDRYIGSECGAFAHRACTS